MTIPPPSEGPSPEARSLLYQILRSHGVIEVPYKRAIPFLEKMCEDQIRLIADALSAAKRSAHLEDARAGCEFCGKPEIYGAARVRKGRSDVRWEHPTPDGGTYLCKRPEVWDALSLLPGGQK